MVTDTLQTEASSTSIDWKRLLFLGLGLGLFALVYGSPPWPDAVDPNGKPFALSPQGKGAIAIFLLAGIWWVFEVLPIGITSITIGVLQVMFMVRPANRAFKDFMDPSVLFIFASLIIGMVFTKTGLTRRIAYKMLSIVGEKTSMIYLGCFVVTAALTHIMAHTAVAATIYPLLMTVHTVYATDRDPTRFGKGLFIGMAYVAGAGSIITLLGAARGAVAIGFFQDIVGREVSFFELSWYMFPVGWVMVFLIWGLVMLFFRPERSRIKGIKERSRLMLDQMGTITRSEVISALIIGCCVLTLSLRSFVPQLAGVNKTAIILVSTILFFILNILDIKDLEAVPWNIILLFGGAMSIVANCELVL